MAESDSFRVAEKYEIKTIVDLHSINGFDKRSIETFLWHYFSKRNPKSFMIVAKLRGEIKGTYGKVFYPLILDAKLINSHKGEAVLISSESRASVDILKFYKYVVKICKNFDSDFSWGITSSLPLIRLVYKKKEINTPLRTYVFPTNVKSIVNLINFSNHSTTVSKLKKSVVILFSPSILLYSKLRYWLFSKKNKLELTKCYVQKNKGDLEKFIFKVSRGNPNSIFIHYTDAFINWRIDNHPKFSTKKIFWYKNSNIIGFSLLTYKNEETEITELIAENISFYKYLLQDLIINESRLNNKIMIAGNYYNELFKKYQSILYKLGFLQINKNEFVFKLISSNYSNEKIETKNWFLSNAWSEGL